jgi:hypothetical protein
MFSVGPDSTARPFSMRTTVCAVAHTSAGSCETSSVAMPRARRNGCIRSHSSIFRSARRECPGQCHALLLSAGEPRREPPAQRLQPEQCSHCRDAFGLHGSGQPVEAEADVPLDRPVGKQRRGLEQETHAALSWRDPRSRLRIDEADCVERDLARLRPGQPGDQAEQRCLAGAGGSKQRGALRVQRKPRFQKQ